MIQIHKPESGQSENDEIDTDSVDEHSCQFPGRTGRQETSATRSDKAAKVGPSFESGELLANTMIEAIAYLVIRMQAGP